MATYMVANGRNAGNYGYGNAVAVVMFLISLIVALLYQRFVLRRDTAGRCHRRELTDERDDPRRTVRRGAPARGSAATGRERGVTRPSTSSPWCSSRSCWARSLYIILGGFRTNSQITVDPAGLPNPGSSATTSTC